MFLGLTPCARINSDLTPEARSAARVDRSAAILASTSGSEK